MIGPRFLRPLGLVLSALLAVPSGVGQTPQPATPKAPGSPLSIMILEGNNSVNSLPLLRSVAPVIEVRDSNDFPVEGATVVFTLPAQGPGGVFAQGGAQGGSAFTTRSDARGQAMAPFIVPSVEGKFQISVTATLGDRKGEAFIAQTNSAGSYIGPAIPPKAWYRKHSTWWIAGSAAAAIIVVVVLTGSKSPATSAAPSTVVITPGSPVFH